MEHEKLICYQKSLRLAQVIGQEVIKLPKGHAYLMDQIKRAIASVVLNCAEGNARISLKERKRFFQISRASIAEVAACLDLMSAFYLITNHQGQEWKAQAEEISKILYKLR